VTNVIDYSKEQEVKDQFKQKMFAKLSSNKKEKEKENDNRTNEVEAEEQKVNKSKNNAKNMHYNEDALESSISIIINE